MHNLLSCDIVADYFLLHVNPLEGDTISNLKIQKLCYYAQAWSLARDDRPLFEERIEAWAHGPVIPELYRRFRKYGQGSIDPFDLLSDPEAELHDDHKRHISEIWTQYGALTGSQLRNLTHRERPWIEARGDTPPAEMCTNEITHESMRDFYRPMLTRQHAADTDTVRTA